MIFDYLNVGEDEEIPLVDALYEGYVSPEEQEELDDAWAIREGVVWDSYSGEAWL